MRPAKRRFASNPVVPKLCLGMRPREALLRNLNPRRNLGIILKRKLPRRSGIASPTGTLHPRESSGTEDRKQITVIAEFSVAPAAENVRDLRRTAGMTPHRGPAPLAREVADIFIPLTRNENSAMTVGGEAPLGNDRESGIIPPENTAGQFPMTTKQKPTAFISHTEADWTRFVEPFAASLRSRQGVEARVYKWEKKSGRERYLEEAKKADVFVPVLSAASVRARGVLAEINEVTDQIVNNPERAIPVILGKLSKEKFPHPLRDWNYVRGCDPAKAAAEVARLIRGEEHPDKPPVGDAVSPIMARVALPAFKLGILLQMAESGDAAAQSALGVMYHEGEGVPQNHAEAAKWFRRAAKQGDAQAQFNLGVMYGKGKGVPRNNSETAKWFRRAAEQGDARAQFNLGVMYGKGKGVPQNDSEAAKWFRRAAEQGDAEAQYNLGVMYGKGKGVPQNDSEAAKWFRRAAKQGHAPAQFNLGVMYGKGEGVPQNDGEAAKWWRLAAERGDAGAQYNIGVMYHEGRGVPQDDAEAAKWWRLAAEQRHAGAQHNLGSSYHKGGGVPQDDAEAAKWWRLAAEQRHAGAQHHLGISYYKGRGVPQDDVEAVRWLRFAAKQGNADAQYNLGSMYSYNSKGIPQDDVEAAKWFRRAAEQGDAEAQYNLALMYGNGMGVPRNRVEAVKWIRRAAKQGLPEAKSILADLQKGGGKKE